LERPLRRKGKEELMKERGREGGIEGEVFIFLKETEGTRKRGKNLGEKRAT